MQNGLKPFGAKAIASPNDRFWNARLQLTLTYTAILAIILCISSSIIYTAFSNQLSRRFERFPSRAPMVLPEGVVAPRPEDVIQDLKMSLLLVNGLLLILAAILSYWLAGLTLEPIQDSYNRQRRFLSDASHELRTPLAILQADLENILSNSQLKKELREQAESQLEETQRMGSIVKDLLLLSQLDEPSIKQDLTQVVDLNALLQAQVKRFEIFAKQHNVRVSYVPTEDNYTVKTQEPLLTQAISNLLKNAVIYNKPKGTVAISLTQEGSLARIDITDTGIGIAQNDVDKIFDRFYRVDKSRSRLTGGSGLGLSITRSAIEQLQGSLELKSEIGIGTTATIFLPLS